MSIGLAIAATTPLTDFGSLERFGADIPMAWIEEALKATGTASIRRRRLPAEAVVWLVLGMALMRDKSIDQVAARLEFVMPGGVGPLARSSIPQARQRVGPKPLKLLFERTATAWALPSADRHRWRGLAVFGMDGTTLRVPDTDVNRAFFGTHETRDGRCRGPYPIVRVVTLMTLRSHVVLGAAIGAYTGGPSELAHGRALLPLVPTSSLLVVDRGYRSVTFFRDVGNVPGRFFLTRLRKSARFNLVEALGPDDSLVDLPVSAAVRAADPTMPATLRLRSIRYRTTLGESTLLTSLVDAKAYPATEIVAMYRERWELELAYDELKTEMLEHEETLRSKTPDGVEQELWAILLGFNLIRIEMERIANECDVPPTRISFVAAMMFMRDLWTGTEGMLSPGNIPKHLQKMRDNVMRFVLPPRRVRSYPRAVKHRETLYPRKTRAFAAK